MKQNRFRFRLNQRKMLALIRCGCASAFATWLFWFRIRSNMYGRTLFSTQIARLHESTVRNFEAA